MPVFTFLDAFSFDGKTVLPLCTNEGSGMGSSESDITKACAGADVKKGLAINGSREGSSDLCLRVAIRTSFGKGIWQNAWTERKGDRYGDV